MKLAIVLTVILLIPVAVFFLNRKLFSGKLRNVSTSAISAACIYVSALASVAYVEYSLDADLATFDLNGDGVFSGNEINFEQERAMHRVTADTGRTFAPFTGAIFSVIYFLGVWFLLTIIRWIGNWREHRKR
tara:strand:- start:680 stop:1075 length:396 start_codon:yes stop_codon:yes gene_type:complete